jgi:hypothetical protein
MWQDHYPSRMEIGQRGILLLNSLMDTFKYVITFYALARSAGHLIF